MKSIIIALATLAAPLAMASAPHCPPGEVNVWGACFEQGYGVLNPIIDHTNTSATCPMHHHHHGMNAAEGWTSAPHCPPGEVNVWGACFEQGYGVFNPHHR